VTTEQYFFASDYASDNTRVDITALGKNNNTVLFALEYASFYSFDIHFCIF